MSIYDDIMDDYEHYREMAFGESELSKKERQIEDLQERICDLEDQVETYKDAFNKAVICNKGMDEQIEKLKNQNKQLMELLGVE